MDFINRKNELDYLNNEYQKQPANFIILYGRRRVGKTRLIKQFFLDKPHIYFLADKQLEVHLLQRMQQEMAAFLNDSLLVKLDFNDWEVLFRYWLERTDFTQKVVLVIDEFQYLVKANPAFPSILQRLWDELFQFQKICLILCGSLIGMMYRSTLSYQSPLYGRRTGQIRLQPIPFLNFRDFFPGFHFQQLVEFYSVIGGVPKYIELIDPNRSILDNIESLMLHQNEYLYNEPRFILNEEITETMTYFSILKTIAQGDHKVGNIAGKLHLAAQNITKYLEVLIDLGVLERQVPVTESQPQKSKQGLYFIKDHFFRFWFHYVFPFQSQLELDATDYVMKKINEDFTRFVAPVFEMICQELVAYWNIKNRLPFHAEKWGRWWNRNQEIDLVAFNTESQEILFGECKWTQKPIDTHVFYQLKEKTRSVNWFARQRTEYFILFSKNGYTPEMEQLAAKDGILLADGFRLRDYRK